MIGIGKNIFKSNVKVGTAAPVYDADALAYFTANTAITSDADKTCSTREILNDCFKPH